MKYLIFFLSATAIITSCKKTECEPYEFATMDIHKSELYGAGDENIDEGNMVIRTQEDWTALLNKIDSVNEESPNFETTDIDFSTQVIIACFDQVRPNGGYSLAIESVTKDGDKVNVNVVKSNSGGFTTQVINQPYEIIAVNACDEEIVFN